MTNHRLSIEQKFQLEAAFRDIDACDDIEKTPWDHKSNHHSAGERKSFC